MSARSLLAEPPSGRAVPLLIDDAEYSTTVIRQGDPIPWTDVTLLAEHFRQVGQLLKPDATWVDIRRIQAAHLHSRPSLVEAMGARSRPGYPLRTLLSDDTLMAATVELLTVLATTTRRSLVLHMPSPGAWVHWAHHAAAVELTVLDEDYADTASMYIAEWLGRLGGIPVALALLDSRTTESSLTEHLRDYSAITNVTAHFDWTPALQTTTGIATRPEDPTVGILPGNFWTEADATNETIADILVTTIPGSATPEGVLDRLNAWPRRV